MEDDLNRLRLLPSVKSKLMNQEAVWEELEQGKNPQEILEFSDSLMEKLYQCAYFLFEEKRFEEASDAFTFLTTLNPHHYAFWLGLGMSLQMCHTYEAAINAYELAALADMASPVPYFYLAKCLFAVHDRQGALQALDLALEAADEDDAYAELKEQAFQAKVQLLKRELDDA